MAAAVMAAVMAAAAMAAVAMAFTTLPTPVTSPSLGATCGRSRSQGSGGKGAMRGKAVAHHVHGGITLLCHPRGRRRVAC